MTLLSKELAALPFTDKLQDILQRHIEYFTVVERMEKNLAFRNKLDEVEADLRYCKSKALVSEDITKIKRKLNQLKDLYNRAEDFLKAKKNFNVKLLFQNYKTVTSSMPEENSLLQYIFIISSK